MTVTATDSCGNSNKIPPIPIHLNHPVSLRVLEEESGWNQGVYGAYVVRFEATDLDLVRCAEDLNLAELLTFTTSIVSTGGGRFTFFAGQREWQVGWLHVSHQRDGRVHVAAEYEPPREGERLAYLFLKVADLWGSEAHWREKVENGPPDMQFPASSPPATSPVKVRRGQEVRVIVEATDKEGDPLALKQIEGPGVFEIADKGRNEDTGESWIRGTYTWTVPKDYSGPTVVKVVFRADDGLKDPPEKVLEIWIINGPPELSLSPWEITARPGETLQATVSATDSDGDRITLTQTSGPGTLVITGAGVDTEGRGWATGTWSWTVPKWYATPWQLVGFRAEDHCGGTSLAYLLVWIRQPPRASNTHAWVRRGETSTASLYVYDPDTPPDELTFAF